MLKKITTTTSASSFGLPPGKKIFKIESGEYAKRMIVILRTSDHEIKFAVADKPYTTWSSLTTIVSDSEIAPFDAAIDTSGNVHLVDVEQTTRYLVSVKLVYADGHWVAGSKVYIYAGAQTNYPSIGVDNSDNLWVAYLKAVSSNFDLYIKSSSDSGATWTYGSASDGDLLKATTTNIVPKVLSSADYLYVVYSSDWSDMKLCAKPTSGTVWGSEFTIASGANVDEHFDAAITKEGLLGVVFDDTAIKYREYDGSNWGSVITIDANGGKFPQLVFQNNIPIIYYLYPYNTDQIEIKYCHRATGLFSAPQTLASNRAVFEKFLLYNTSSATYEDLTTAAANDTSADVLHSNNNKMLSKAGDLVYLGLSNKFRFIKMLLSSVGTGGAVAYSYWDGSNWVSFTPADGAYHLTSAGYDLLLWDDISSIPLDWQKKVVDGSNLFWMKIEVVSDFTTSPVGSQITSISDIEAVNIRR